MWNAPTGRVRFVALALLAATGWPALSAADEARPGATVRVTTTPGTAGDGSLSGGVLRGRLIELDERSITLLTSEKERVSVPRRDVVRLEMRKVSGRGRNALIGAGIGAAIGLVVAAAEHARCGGEMLCGVEFALPLLTAPLGAAVGAAFPGREAWVPVSPAAVSIGASRSGVSVACAVRF